MSKNFCGDCDFNGNGLCIVHRWDVSNESPICSVYRKTYPGTVFQEITESPEVLAEDLVYEIGAMWMSTLITDATFETYEEAYAETVARLKEVER